MHYLLQIPRNNMVEEGGSSTSTTSHNELNTSNNEGLLGGFDFPQYIFVVGCNEATKIPFATLIMEVKKVASKQTTISTPNVMYSIMEPFFYVH